MKSWILILFAGLALGAEPKARPNDGKGPKSVPVCSHVAGYTRTIAELEATSAHCRLEFEEGSNMSKRQALSHKMLELKVKLEEAWHRCKLSAESQPSVWELEVVWKPDANQWPNEFDGCFGAPYGIGYCGDDIEDN